MAAVADGKVGRELEIAAGDNRPSWSVYRFVATLLVMVVSKLDSIVVAIGATAVVNDHSLQEAGQRLQATLLWTDKQAQQLATIGQPGPCGTSKKEHFICSIVCGGWDRGGATRIG